VFAGKHSVCAPDSNANHALQPTTSTATSTSTGKHQEHPDSYSVNYFAPTATFYCHAKRQTRHLHHSVSGAYSAASYYATPTSLPLLTNLPPLRTLRRLLLLLRPANSGHLHPTSVSDTSHRRQHRKYVLTGPCGLLVSIRVNVVDEISVLSLKPNRIPKFIY